MAKLQDVIADALQRLFNFIGESVSYILGLLGAIIMGALPAAAEIADDLSNFEHDPLYWNHIVKIAAAGVIPALAAYVGGQKAINRALATPPPETKP